MAYSVSKHRALLYIGCYLDNDNLFIPIKDNQLPISPKELFNEEQGLIRIIVGGIDIHSFNCEYQILNRGIIRYEIIGTTKVRLSPVD